MEILDINIADLKQQYKANRKIEIKNIVFGIGLLKGAINEFVLFYKGKKYPVITDGKEISFIVFD
jgi:hypothetical protein